MEFGNFPFLRDQLFVSFFKSQSLQIKDHFHNFDEFVFKSQLEYYRKFINPNFEPSSLVPPSGAPKCPYASQWNRNSSASFAVEQLSILRYCFIESVHISDMNLPGLTVNIVKPGTGSSLSCPIAIFTSGRHSSVDFTTGSINIIVSDASFSSLPEIPSLPIYTELSKTNTVLSPSDVLFFFPASTLIINPMDVDKFLNIFVYLNLAGLTDISLNTLKAVGIGGKALNPSRFQAYSDILTVEYIRTNPELFS